MNRLQAYPMVTASSETVSSKSARARSAGRSGASLYAPARGENACSYFAPLHYESNYAYPLLVWLHGEGDDENQLKRIMPLVSLRNYVGVSVRGTMRMNRADGRPVYAWSQARADVALAEQRVFESIEAARARYHIAPSRIFVAGFDCGGTMAFRLAMAHPESFAGVLSLCGGFPGSRRPLVRLPEARRVPIFLACGRDSERYETGEVCENLKLFHTAGMHVALRQYPCGHQIAPRMLSDMDRWMMEQITSPEQSGLARNAD